MRPNQVDAVSEYELDDDLIIYDPRNDHAHVLNGTAAVVWWLCDGEHTVEQITSEVASMYDLRSGQVMDDVEAAVATLAEAGLISGAPVERKAGKR